MEGLFLYKLMKAKYRTLSDKNRFREWRLAPKRGIVRDYFNNEIASNEKVYQLHITPENTQNIDALFVRLKSILNLSNERIFALKRKIAKQNRGNLLLFLKI